MKKTLVLRVVLIFLIVAFAAVGVFAAFKIYSAKRENERLAAEKEAQAYPYKTVEYNGKTYDYNEGVYNLLVLGIDAEGEYEEGEFFETGGKADAIFILSINNSKKTVSTIQLNRDTVTEIQKLGVFGDPVTTLNAQLATAYAYGSGGKSSCENMSRAVSGLLYGVPIDGYLAMNMEGIIPFVNAVGGVTVTLKDDFTKFAPEMEAGKTLTLDGAKAYIYLRGRGDVGDQLNTSRMERHRTFYSELFKQVDKLLGSDVSKLKSVYDAIYPYSYFSISLSKLMSLYSDSSDYRRVPTVTPEGVINEDAEYTEFYADETALRKLVFDVWYTERKNSQ